MDFHLTAGPPENPFEHAAQSFDADRIASASAEIRNALVPLQTIANVLHRRDDDDAESRAWCVKMLEVEVKRIVDILDTL